MWNSLEEYASRTRASCYTLALVLPFLLVYEVGLVALRLTRADFHARNGADAIIRFVLFPLGLHGAGRWGALLWSLASAGVLFICYLIWHAREETPRALEIRYVCWLFAESAAWAAILFAVSVAFFSGTMGADAARAAAEGARHSLAAELVFNAGAGVYEELVFRVLLVLALALFFTGILHLEPTTGGLAAAASAAVLFSLAHFGSRPGADPWGGQGFWTLFAFRWAAGMFFSLLFYFRCFGVAVAAHAFYDSLVTLQGEL